MSRKLSPSREPKVGLDEPSYLEEREFLRQSQAMPKAQGHGFKVFGFGTLLCLLILGMFSLGFVLGQEWGQKRSDLHWMSLNLKNEQQIKAVGDNSFGQGAPQVHAANHETMLRDIKAGLVQMHEVGEELKLKLINTHELYASMIGLPEQMRSLESLMRQWEANKISLVQDPCPASNTLPRMLPSHVKTATK
ncbi:MAG: hypothetical protein HRU09_11145 [Oligoflexales bacterium]|nr:hypothetical protein [Oligoflexales bacterium]